MCTQNPNLLLNFSRKRFFKRSNTLLQEVERGTVGGGERGALPSGPLHITESAATAGHSEDPPAVTTNTNKVATANKQDNSAEHAPLGAGEKVR